mgnify:CR=1 FL=1
MAGCDRLDLRIDWSQIPVNHILKNMTSMTSTLNGGFGQYAKAYESLGSDPDGQAKLFDNWYVLRGQHLWKADNLGDYDPRGYIENLAKNIAKPLKPLVRFYLLKILFCLPKYSISLESNMCDESLLFNLQFSWIMVNRIKFE